MITFRSIAPLKRIKRIARATKFVMQGDSNRFRY
ncbi:hypothetical protein ILFOPFJJ_05448 [Ensifer psoraleae]|nr:hypothetical protein [Sinorhizobium psoraleae]